MFEERLIQMVNRGSCLALIGAGLSKEIGYPDWGQLAEQTFAKVKETVEEVDEVSYTRYLENSRYPELFSQAERDLGSRESFEAVVASFLDFSPSTLGEAYKIICRWPFACYLTTNLDDEIQRHLRQLSVEFSVEDNTPSSLAGLRTDTRDVIFKLHSDFRLAGKPTLTSADYHELYATVGGGCYRDCLKAVFQKFDVLIVGYSLADPDMSYILELAKEGASPAHPIYMVGPNDDFTDADASEFRERYNIRLLRYSNEDGCHRQLRRTLETYDCFIQPRNTSPMQRVLSDEEVQESLDALSLFLYRKLSADGADQMIAPLVLSELAKAAPDDKSIQELCTDAMHGVLQNTDDSENIVEDALAYLQKNSDVERIEDRYRISEDGRKKLDQIVFDGRAIKTRAFGQFKSTVREHCAAITEEQEEQACSALETAITTAFSKHSAAIVNAILSESDTAAHEGMALFQYIRDAATCLPKGEVFSAYITSASRFIFSPTEDQKRYLGSLAQGFFLAHLLGEDPRLQAIRRETLQEAAWLVDSCILIPLVARECGLSDFAESLFSHLKMLKGFAFTTTKIVREVWEHFKWARHQTRRYSVEELESLYSCVMSDTYKQNLFLEGYASYAVAHGVQSFAEYATECFGDSPSIDAIEGRLGDYGIVVLNPQSLITDVDELQEWKNEITQTRRDRRTWRSAFQTEVESEAYWAIQNYEKIAEKNGKTGVHRAYFVSDSNVLNGVAKRCVTWLPEGLLRYLSGISGIELSDSVMQQCVLESISDAFGLVDRRRFLDFFGKRIDIAKFDFDKEKHRYIESVERTNLQELEDAFAATPDVEKPQFLSQMGWEIARAEERKREEAQRQKNRAMDELEIAQRRIRELEREKDAGWRRKQAESEKQEAARLRNLQDPKHLRKRKRQAKERKKKKG